jgi:sarcosine oxidase delta subunit
MVASIGFSDMLSLAQTIGIVGTMVLTLYFSKKQIQSLSIDQQTRVLNDLDEKFHNMAELAMEDPSIQKVIDNQGTQSRELAFSFYILWICSHAHAMRQRKVLDDNEWAGWLQWMRNCFRKGTIKETWKQVESDRWFNPAFQNFINTEIAAAILEPNQK